MNSDDISAHARQFRRHATTFEARIEPHPDHADQFRLSFPDTQMGMAIVDVSKGGLGLKTGIYIPRNMRLTLHISSVGTEGDLEGGGLTMTGIVRRCIMLDHKPTYQIGVQFVNPNGRDERTLIESATGAAQETAQAATVGGTGGA